MLNFNPYRSVSCVCFCTDISARFWKEERKMLRCPLVKPVSNGSLVGTAPFSDPGASSGSVKQLLFNATSPNAPDLPVRAFFGVQPAANGTIGLVMPSAVE